MLKISRLLLVLLLPAIAIAAPAPDLLPYWITENPNSVQTIDHSRWQAFLDRYLIKSDTQQLVRYKQVSNEDKSALRMYTKLLASLDPKNLNRAEQKPYWINLYNALTVLTVLEHYPIDSILDIRSSWFSPGPWKNDVIEISGQRLSLNDIEHGILRPIYQDPRIHYALNCASIGCPNLQPQAFTRQNTESLLEQSATEFINSHKGVLVSVTGARLSKIYEWYTDDFGLTTEDLMIHFNQYLTDSVSNKQLKNMEFQYDWNLNEATE